MNDRVRREKPGELISRGQSHEFMCKFERAGGTSAMIQAAVEEEAVMKFVIRNWSEAPKEHVSMRTARSSGITILGAEEEAVHLGVTPKEHQHAALEAIPFSKHQLSAMRDTHLLVAVFPRSIYGLRRQFGDEHIGGSYFRTCGGRLANPAFFHYTGDTRWELIRKEPLVDTLNQSRTMQEQQLRAVGERVLDAQSIVYATWLYFLLTGKRLFQNCVVRTRDHFDDFGPDFGSGGNEQVAFAHEDGGYAVNYVAVGHFTGNRLSIINDGEGPAVIGAASSVTY